MDITISDEVYHQLSNEVWNLLDHHELQPCTCQYGDTLLSALRGTFCKCTCENSTLALIERKMADGESFDNVLLTSTHYKTIYVIVRFVIEIMIERKCQ